MRNLEVRFKRAPTMPRELEVVPAEAAHLTRGGILCRARGRAADTLSALVAGAARPGRGGAGAGRLRSHRITQ